MVFLATKKKKKAKKQYKLFGDKNIYQGTDLPVHIDIHSNKRFVSVLPSDVQVEQSTQSLQSPQSF